MPASSSSRFPSLKTQDDVATILEIKWETLRHLIFRMPKDRLYREFTIGKRNGGTRTLSVPCQSLKQVQTTLLELFERTYYPPASVHGFTFERGIVTNAKRHVGARWLLNIDIQDFFPSIHIGRLIGLFRAWPFLAEKEAATLLAQICTHNKCLPQGAPTSPIISNMVCFKMDQMLLNLAKAYRCIYTRYADDITISTRLNELPPPIACFQDSNIVLGEELCEVIANANFTVNPQKIRLQNHRQRMVVTGLKINRFPNVRKSLISQIRAMLHAWKKHGYDAAEAEYIRNYEKRHRNPNSFRISFRHVLLGKLLFLGQVRGFSDKRFTEFAQKLYELDPGLLPRSPAYHASHMARAATCVLTDQDEYKTGTGFFLKGIGLVTCHHVAEFATRAFYPDSPGKSFPVKTLESNPNSDLAICQTDLAPRYELQDRLNDLPNGSGVFVFGFPQYNPGFLGQFQNGKILSRRQLHGTTRYILSTRIVAGNSGGPLLDAFGNAVGVVVTGDVDQSDGYSPNDWGAIPMRFLSTFNTYMATRSAEHVSPG